MVFESIIGPKYEQTLFILKLLNSTNVPDINISRLNSESLSSIMCYEELRQYIY